MQQVSKRRLYPCRAAAYSKPAIAHRGNALTARGSPAADAARLVPATCGGEINQM
jgi:hypothetical protein